jgi:endonuclease-3
MTKNERTTFIAETLNQLFPAPAIPLRHSDAYTLLIAVVLSAQCTDERVNKITPVLFSRAKNPLAMMELGQNNIYEIIKPCGLAPAKSKAIYHLSRLLLERHAGKVPDSFQALEALPGVGHKTASVVMSQAFGVPAFPVDTHIHRLAKRWKLSNGTSVEQTEKDLKKCFPEKSWNTLHLQMIYFGRTYCPARGHHADKCPICSRVNKKAK